MKRLLALLMLGFAVIAEPLSSKFKAMHADALIAHAEESSQAVKSIELDAAAFDLDDENLDKLPKWNPDTLSPDAENGSVEQLNYFANGNSHVYVDNCIDVFSSISEIDEYFDFIQVNPLHPNVLNGSITYINLDLTGNEPYYYGAYYQHSSPLIYFDQSLIGKQNLIFYLDISFQMDDFIKLKNRFQDKLIGSLPLIIVNDKFTFLKIEFTEKGCYLKTDNYARIDIVRRNPLSSNETNEKKCMRLTIPYVESIDDLKVYVGNHGKDSSSLPQITGSNLFCFDQVLHDHYYFYVFDVCNFSLINGLLAIDTKSYYAQGKTAVPSQKTWNAKLVSMKVSFRGNKKIYNTTPMELEPKKLNYNPRGPIFEPISKVMEMTFLPNIFQDENNLDYYFFMRGFDLPDNASGEFKILSISFHPQIYNPDTHRYYVNEAITYTQHYEYTNMHKYSFDLRNAVRVYYYDMVSYFRYLFVNSKHVFEFIADLFRSTTHNYICFGFDFYFDKQKSNPIPNVKEITFKYQRGYKEPNPEPESNGFYPNCGDPYKDIHVRTMEVNENRVRGLGVLDDEGMCLTNNAAPEMMTNDGVTYDYLLYQYRERGDDPGITTMDALEICYESIAGETVRMVGNSKGLHVVVDDDGIARVYNSEGNLEEDYGVYESADGSLVPGKDEDGNGKIESDEVVNSDTGEKHYAPFEDDSSWLQKFVDSIDNFFNEKKARIISTLVVVGLIVVAVIFIPILFRKKNG